MPVTLTDKEGKKHTFSTHDSAVSWLKINRPNIKDPDAYVAAIERKMSKKKTRTYQDGLVGDRSEISVSNLIRGNLNFDISDNIVVRSVEIFLIGVDEAIVELEVTDEEFGASFLYEITARNRVGNYKVVWNVLVSGKEIKVFNDFVISGDEIDRTLPLELQHLK